MSEKYSKCNCDVCGADQPISIEIAKKYTNGQPIQVCNVCGFVYVNERRSSDEIAKSWSDEIFQKGYTAKIPYVLARQTYVADFIDVNVGVENKSICDIGAGEGQFLSICKNKANNVQVFGIEPSAYNITLLQKQDIPAFHGTIEQYKASPQFKAGAFDLVTIMWTLENCYDCNTMLNVAWDLLKDNGHIVIATGSRILVPFKKPLNDYLSKNPADTHPFRFSANSIQNLLRKSNFNIAELNRYQDGDFLVVIASKNPKKAEKFEIKADNPRLVVEFFNRWDVETEWMKENALV